MKTPININLDGKVVVITGAGGVICGALAKAVASNGAKVALLDLNLESAQAVADEILCDGGIARLIWRPSRHGSHRPHRGKH